MKISKNLIIAIFGFVCCLIFYNSVLASGAPYFTGSTPANYVTTTAGSNINVLVDSDDAIGAEHELVMDWNQKLIGWWRLNTNGDLTDYSSYGNSMTNNGATWSADGKYGGSYYFDAATDYMLATDADLNITATDEYSFSVWVKPSSTSYNRILHLGTDGSSGSYMGFLTGGPGQTVEYAMRQNWVGDWKGVTSVATISSSTWNHIVLTSDGINLKIYINGSLSNTQALGAFTNYTATFNLSIGKDIWSNYFEGYIDDVQFYKRTLSAGEISSLYNAQDNQYSSSFTLGGNGTYLYRAYAQDTSGIVTSTERTIYVGVTPPAYTLTYSAGTGGTITGSSTQTIAIGQGGSEIIAVPDTGYTFNSWSDGLTTTQRTDTNITANTSYTASFTTSTYTLNYTAGVGGSLSGSASQTINYGDNGSAITAVANTGHTFSRWSDNRTTNPRTDVNITGNLNISAIFSVVESGNSTAPVPAPTIIIPPSISNNTINSAITNVFQMAISEKSDFSDSVWQPYNESFKVIKKTIYIKFRSPQGGESKTFTINNSGTATTQQTQIVTSTEYYKFNKNLKLGMKNSEVKELQKFLNNRGFLVDTQGFGSPGQETIYFGLLTQQALIKFQKSADLPAFGYFGPMTRNFILKK